MKNIITLWENQVSKKKDELAICYKDRQYNYGSIDSMANAIAEEIDKISKSSLVGVMMTSSAEYVISVLGILKSGRGFVPIDKNYPQERKKHIIKECNLDAIIVMDKKDERLSDNIAYINFEYSKRKYDKDNNIKNEIAYVMYTSGTTGIPKGIMVGHDSVENLVNWFDETYDINKNKKVIQMANISFDVSIEEIFGCILNGGILYIPEENIKSHKVRIREFIKKYEINLIQVVPVLLEEIFANDELLESIEVLICGGEALSNELKDSIIAKGYSLYNHYGPTETTVDATRSICKKDRKVTLGIPLRNCFCYVLTPSGELVEKEASGELCIAGRNLALGYINNDDLTSEKFIVINGIRLFKTGDKVYINSDGEIEFFGRIDTQVKINGRRIELDEIDHNFLKLEGIVLCKSLLIEYETGKKIVTFYNSKKEFCYSEIVTNLKEYLPDYMIPVEILWISHFEQDSNGKISKKSLEQLFSKLKNEQELEVKNYKIESEGDEILIALMRIFSNILKKDMDQLNPDAPLREIGLDSIHFVQTVVELECMYDVIFEDDMLVLHIYQTARELSNYVKGLLGH